MKARLINPPKEAPRLHRNELEAVGVHQRQEHATEEVVARSKRDEHGEPRNGADRLERTADVDPGRAVLTVRGGLGVGLVEDDGLQVARARRG